MDQLREFLDTGAFLLLHRVGVKERAGRNGYRSANR